eukprot:TRINITY_DN3022_c0_g1_i2.p1 TRINITY_DN3022_c0_g1~~TRINITY_DN3022_c0_g1_i2.p1  ORF type:complete len:294 (+),score=56.91 TRINITY_DN3022_c0_g1_i2:231-1112(+)
MIKNKKDMEEKIERIKRIFEKFGSFDEEPILLQGGRGTVYKSGDKIIKPVDNELENKEISLLMSTKVKSTNELRFSNPIRSTNDNWIEDGYVCWSYLDGKECVGRYDEKIKICTLYSEAFKDIEQPEFCKNMPRNAWNIADEMVWDENIKNLKFEPKFSEIVHQIIDKFLPINFQNQIIHGDIGGNILFSEIGNPPAVIDLTFYWRPYYFTHAFLVVDSISWCDADPIELYGYVKDYPDIDQLLYRAALRRILEQQEHYHFGKNFDLCYTEAFCFITTLKKLKLLDFKNQKTI